MKYVDQYGEEDADFIWGTMHPKIETNKAFYIRIGEFEYSHAYQKFRAKMEETGKELAIVEGDLAMLESLIGGEWDEERFLTVPPGLAIAGVYDMDEVMKAV
jgi:hypothetical protein